MSAVLKKLLTELRGNRRLLAGLAIVALVVVIEGGLRWSDWLGAQQITLTKLRAELSDLKTHTRDEAALRTALSQAQRMGNAMDARLWSVSSEAVGQARMKDWLTDIVKRSIANQYAVTLAASRELGKPGAADPSGAQGSVQGGTAPTLREFRATVSFQLTPRALEGVLLEIEGGEPFAAVETLLVKKQERRVELTVRVIMRIKAPSHA
ncbi:hypothetical protein [Rhodoferax sp.]|uniref:hypothetical protein n=1 Tax=Rhodoferax sp. TaxID=50421 RepID=UPI002763FE6A|nr:hypothetical protein [Rhodoferax sp.]